MSGHRRVKDVAYDEDDEEDYEEEGDQDGQQGPTAEDEANLQQGAITVRKELGPEFPASEKEIKEAIWYYYWDLEQTISYLKRKYAPPPPKKEKQLSRFETAAQVLKTKEVKKSRTLGHRYISSKHSATCSRPFSVADFFKDTPWLNVPSERLANIMVEPLFPRGGLLGGSSEATGGKPSKLAALAAARKKAQEDKRKVQVQDQQSNVGDAEARKSSSHSSSEPAEHPRTPSGGQSSMRSNEQDDVSLPMAKRQRIHPHHEHGGPFQQIPPEPAAPDNVEPESSQNSKSAEVDFKATPSIFARTMLGEGLPHHSQMTEANLISLPFLQNMNHTNNAFAGPSPDDVVAKAQLKSLKPKTTTTTSTPTKKMNVDTNSVSNGVASIKLDDSPKSSSKGKNLDVLSEFEKSSIKNAANFVVIGHVDHGKSTLMGRLLYDLKVVNQRSVDKLRAEATTIGKSSFALAWVMDSTADERQRGITVDIATNNFETEKTRFTILDAPGHRDFIPNMIAGASQADFAVLVIDSSVNAFEAGLKGQTKEHALLVRSMGIARIIVAVNKMDTSHWSQDRFNEISQQMTAFFLAAGFLAKNIAFIPCAGLTGENVVTKLEGGIAPWYKGNTLVEELEASEPGKRALTQPLRLTIGDVFRGGIQNPLSISGRIDAGFLQTGDVILAMPAGETATVKAVEVEGKPTDWAVAGQIATLHLADVDPVHLRQGDILCSPTNHPITNVKTFTAKILGFEHVTPGWVDVHKGRLHTPARVTELLAVLDKSSGAVEKKKPRVVKPGSVARIRVELDKALPLEALGRVVLRSEGTTLAAGLIEKVDLL